MLTSNQNVIQAVASGAGGSVQRMTPQMSQQPNARPITRAAIFPPQEIDPNMVKEKLASGTYTRGSIVDLSI